MGPISKPTPKHHRAITSGFTDHVSSLSAAFASDDKDEDLFCYTRVCVDFSSFFSLSFTPPPRTRYSILLVHCQLATLRWLGVDTTLNGNSILYGSGVCVYCRLVKARASPPCLGADDPEDGFPCQQLAELDLDKVAVWFHGALFFFLFQTKLGK